MCRQVRSRDQASRQDTLMLVTCDEVRVPEPNHTLPSWLRNNMLTTPISLRLHARRQQRAQGG